MPKFPVALTASALIACSTMTAVGQDQPAQSKGAPFPFASIPEKSGPVFQTIEFPGGSVSDYLAVLKKANGGYAVNVIVTKDALGVELAPMELHMVSLATAIHAIGAAVGDSVGSFSIQTVKGVASNTEPAFSVDFRARPRGTVESPKAQPELRVFSLRSITEQIGGEAPAITEPADTVLTAVQTALGLGGEAAGTEMKYHAASGLLIVRATPEQLRSVEECVDRMSSDLRDRRSAARAAALPPEALIERRANVEKCKVLMEQRQREHEDAMMQLDRTQKLFEAGSVPEPQLMEARSNVTRAQSRVSEVEVEFKRSLQLLEMLESRAPKPLGPVVLDMTGWDKAQYDQAVEMLRTLFKERAGVKIEVVKGQTVVIAGEAPLVESATTIVREIARARGVAEPRIAPASDGQKPGR